MTTDQNTRPTPSSDVAAKMRLPWTYVLATPLQTDWIEDCNGEIVVDCIGHIDGPFIVERANAALTATHAKPTYPKTIDCRSPVEHAIVEYHLVDNLAGEAEKMGRHSAIRGMMVRLGMYDEFVRALEAGDDYEPPLQDAKPVVPAQTGVSR